jgi:hypothetical protein
MRKPQIEQTREENDDDNQQTRQQGVILPH